MPRHRPETHMYRAHITYMRGVGDSIEYSFEHSKVHYIHFGLHRVWFVMTRYEAKQADRHPDDMDPELRTVILGEDSAAPHGTVYAESTCKTASRLGRNETCGLMHVQCMHKAPK